MNQRDLRVRIDSQFEDKGFKSAEASAKAMVRELDRQEKAVRDLANLQMQAQRENERRQAAQLMGMERLGRGFTAMGLLAAAGMGLAAKAASDWESAWAGVTKTTTGTADEMADLERSLRDLTKILPATHEEIAAVAEEAGALGVARQDLAAFTKTAIDLGETTDLSANDAANGLARLGNVMGTLPKEADRAGAALVALGNDGASTESEILAMAQRIAGAGRTIGLTEAQVLGLASGLASVGLEAEAGGSAISRVMVEMAKSVETGSDELGTFAKVAGMSADEFSTKFRTDAAGAVTAFVQGLGRIQASGQGAFTTLDELGLSEIRVRDTLLRSAAAGDLLTQSIDKGSAAWADNTALVDEANKRYETSASRIAIARNQLNDAAIDIGGTVLPAIAGAAERVGFLAEAFQSLPDGAQSAVGWLGGIVATLSTLGGGALMAIPKLKEMNETLAMTGPRGAAAAKGMSSFGSALMGPWGIALAGATVALGLWMEKQYEAKQRTQELTASLDTQTGAVTGNTRALVAAELRQRGIIDAAEKLGIASKTVVDAATGEADALAVLESAAARAQRAHEDATPSLKDFAGGQLDLADVSRQSSEAQARQGDGAVYLLSQIRPLHDEINGLTEDKRADAEASGVATEAASGFSAGLEEISDSAGIAADEIKDLIEAIEGYGDTTINARKANRDYQETLDEIAEREKDRLDLQKRLNEAEGRKADTKDEKKSKADEIARLREELEKYNHTLDANTEAGRANQELQEKLSADTLHRATAYFQEGRSIEDVTKMVMSGREEFIKFSMRMGDSRKEAEAAADKFGLTRENIDTLREAVEKVPTSHATNMIVATAAARAAVARLQTNINSLRGITVDVGVRAVWSEKSAGGGRNTQGGQTRFDGGGYTGDGGKYEAAGIVDKGEFVSTMETTNRWRGLLETLHSGGDPVAYLGGGQHAGAPTSGPTTFNETTNRPVYVTVQNLHANDVDDFADKSDAAAFRNAMGRVS